MSCTWELQTFFFAHNMRLYEWPKCDCKSFARYGLKLISEILSFRQFRTKVSFFSFYKNKEFFFLFPPPPQTKKKKPKTYQNFSQGIYCCFFTFLSKKNKSRNVKKIFFYCRVWSLFGDIFFLNYFFGKKQFWEKK